MIYPWIWRHLPGPWFVKLVLALALLAFIVWLLFTYVFPHIAPLMPFSETSVEHPEGGNTIIDQ